VVSALRFLIKIVLIGGFVHSMQGFLRPCPKIESHPKIGKIIQSGACQKPKLKPIPKWDKPVVFVGVLALMWEVRKYIFER
jgi:hypothetical protein